MRANDEATQGYYVAELLTKPYTVQKNIVTKGIWSTTYFFAGEITYDDRFEKEKDWWNKYATKYMQQETSNKFKYNEDRWWWYMWDNWTGT